MVVTVWVVSRLPLGPYPFFMTAFISPSHREVQNSTEAPATVVGTFLSFLDYTRLSNLGRVSRPTAPPRSGGPTPGLAGGHRCGMPLPGDAVAQFTAWENARLEWCLNGIPHHRHSLPLQQLGLAITARCSPMDWPVVIVDSGIAATMLSTWSLRRAKASDFAMVD
ncbi:hypothetical protein [Synechococcus sp. BA-132 BA5]|uniref:hypothetical protein n=1 Tax=Synechococcus sp. BA-132 BA5 TaxID=3110252 RepID=UPI002B1F9115|nr:hypothetical protein [Synechococcus sp. BA-132 BA5]MEA5413818.1 hypothetical protein [Synechococcus sp. BA-132 BA5]